MPSWELGELIEEEHTVVGQGSLARDRVAAASADKGGLGCCVVGRAKGRGLVEATAPSGGGPQHRGLDRLLDLQAGKQPPDPSGEHGLARAGRAMQEKVMATGGRDLQRPSRHELAPDVGEVERRKRWRRFVGPGRLPSLQALTKQTHRLGESAHAVSAGPGYRSRLPRDSCSDEARDVVTRPEHRGSEGVVTRPHPAVETELPDHDCSS